MTRDQVLAKVRALLNLSKNDGAYEGEAENAANLAQTLLMKYGLSFQNVNTQDDDGPKASAEDVTEATEHFQNEKFAGQWKAILLNYCARSTGCRCIYAAGRAGLVIVGTETNRAVAVDLWKWLVQQINLACMKAYEEAWRDETPATFRKQFVWGATHKLGERLERARRETANNKPDWYTGSHADYHKQTTALIVRTQQDVDQYFRKRFPHTTRGRSTTTNCRGAGYHYGQQAAAGMSLGNAARVTAGYKTIGGPK